MKKWLPIFLICLITFISLTPKVGIFAYTEDEYYEAIASYFLADMLISGDANELSFDVDNNTEFLIDFGEALVTGDYTGLAEYGLERVQDLISNVRTSIYDAIYAINPDIYDFLISDSYVSVKPSYGHLTRHLLTELTDNNSNPTPNPNPNYTLYLDYINAQNSANRDQFWFFDFPQQTSINRFTATNNKYPVTEYTWAVVQSTNGGNVSTFYDGVVYKETPLSVPLPILDIYIIGSYNNYSYSVTFTPDSSSYLIATDFNSNNNIFALNSNNVKYYTHMSTYPIITNTINRSFTGSLENVLSHIGGFFKNCNIYVNGLPWSIVGTSNSEPIVLGDSLTILNNQPASYYYSEPVYFDMGGLTAIIKNAINNSNVLTYNDIKDLIVDINGQEAIAVINFTRTDYDVLASEQIPYYPKFYYDSNLNQYVESGATIINISTEVLPRDVLNIIITCGVLLLFGYVVRRLLE